MTQPIWNSGRVVILDSGFCVLQGLIELAKMGLYASALIKKKVLVKICGGQESQTTL